MEGTAATPVACVPKACKRWHETVAGCRSFASQSVDCVRSLPAMATATDGRADGDPIGCTAPAGYDRDRTSTAGEYDVPAGAKPIEWRLPGYRFTDNAAAVNKRIDWCRRARKSRCCSTCSRTAAASRSGNWADAGDAQTLLAPCPRSPHIATTVPILPNRPQKAVARDELRCNAWRSQVSSATPV